MLEREEVNKCRQDGNVRVVASWGLRPQTPHRSVGVFVSARAAPQTGQDSGTPRDGTGLGNAAATDLVKGQPRA